MKIYLVGGAVRDKLLGLPVKDRDWLVVGATPEEMLAHNFRPVGQDFPVFLHPDTNEEYALARTERKSGHGYAGFSFYAAPDITLEEDLKRRDLTINAIAEDKSGKIIDPYKGTQDLKNRVLRHVSPAFQEDPLRVLRIARFLARFHAKGFRIAEETSLLIQSMVDSGELNYLVAERVWQETSRALMESAPQMYFSQLQAFNALQTVLPSWQTLLTDTVDMQALMLAANEKEPLAIRFACLFMSKNDSSQDKIRALLSQMRIPTSCADLAILVTQHQPHIAQTLYSRSAESFMALYEATDALRRSDRFRDFLTVCHYQSQARKASLNQAAIKQAFTLLDTCKSINSKTLIQSRLKGKAIGLALRRHRIQQMQKLIDTPSDAESTK